MEQRSGWFSLRSDFDKKKISNIRQYEYSNGANVWMVLTEVRFWKRREEKKLNLHLDFRRYSQVAWPPKWLFLLFTFSMFQVVNDSNIQYLNPDDDDEPGVQLYVTQVHVQKELVNNESLNTFFWMCNMPGHDLAVSPENDDIFGFVKS